MKYIYSSCFKRDKLKVHSKILHLQQVPFTVCDMILYEQKCEWNFVTMNYTVLYKNVMCYVLVDTGCSFVS